MKQYILLGLLLSAELQAMSLFNHYKTLKQSIPYVQLTPTATPIMRCSNLEKALRHDFIYMKRDDLTGAEGLYGGNKVRKLEFLLGDAQQNNAKTIITYGCFGTNHGLATACYANKLGYECILMLKPQPNTPVVRNNLLLDHYFNAEIKTYPDNATRNKACTALVNAIPDAYFFPTGGSTARGALGYVNAAFELKEQIECGIMPEPHYIYLPLGSGGTTAGLLLGLRLAGLQTVICGIAVEPEESLNEFEETVMRLFRETNELLHDYDANIPLLDFPHDQLIINKTLMGPDYGAWMRAGQDATQLLLTQEGIACEGTYSAKALAGLTADLQQGVRKPDDVILLWNTYCGSDFSHLTSTVNYKDLNPAFHTYFESTQPDSIHDVDAELLSTLTVTKRK